MLERQPQSSPQPGEYEFSITDSFTYLFESCRLNLWDNLTPTLALYSYAPSSDQTLQGTQINLEEINGDGCI